MNELQRVFVPQKLNVRRKFIISVPEFHPCREKIEDGKHITDICASGGMTAEQFTKMMEPDIFDPEIIMQKTMKFLLDNAELTAE